MVQPLADEIKRIHPRQVLDALQQLGATWGEAALLTTGGGSAVGPGPWAAVAQSLAQVDWT